jgi:hypothetical protein
MPTLRNGQTVTFVNRTVTGQDAYNNDVYTANSTDVPGCAVSPGTSTENWAGTMEIESDIVVYAPPGTVVDLPWDEMIFNGVTYNIVGTPGSWQSPFTGTQSMLEIKGKLVTTGGPAT